MTKNEKTKALRETMTALLAADLRNPDAATRRYTGVMSPNLRCELLFAEAKFICESASTGKLKVGDTTI